MGAKLRKMLKNDYLTKIYFTLNYAVCTGMRKNADKNMGMDMINILQKFHTKSFLMYFDIIE